MGVNSADKLTAIVPRILNKRELSFLDGFYVSAVRSSLFYLMSLLWRSFQSDIFKGKKYQNCSNVLWRLRGTKLKCNLIKLDIHCVREVFFSFFLFSVKCCCVVLCKKGKLTTRLLTWVFLSKNYSWRLEGLCDWWARELCVCTCHTNHSVGFIKERIKEKIR